METLGGGVETKFVVVAREVVVRKEEAISVLEQRSELCSEFQQFFEEDACLFKLSVAGILGLQAEKAQNHGRHLRVLFIECKEPVHQAYRLGIAAAALLALAHFIANLLGGCM